MTSYLLIAEDKRDVSELLTSQHLEEVFLNLWLWHLHTNGKHPHVIETRLAVISAENVE